MLTIIKPPSSITMDGNLGAYIIFLAGSIENGKATPWQKDAEKFFKDNCKEDIIILNPRRDDWDSTWEQKATNPLFKEQVDWEREGLLESDYILMYFDPATKSPITLLELGEHSSSGKLVVVCPDGFWRKGNVDLTCIYHQIPTYPTLNQAINHIINRLS